MRFILIAITVVCLFGSLSILTPTTLWNDFTYFFRKNKTDYLKFSNKFRVKFYLVLGLISLFVLILTFFVDFKLSPLSIFAVFFICLIIGRICLEILWRHQSKKLILN